VSDTSKELPKWTLATLDRQAHYDMARIEAILEADLTVFDLAEQVGRIRATVEAWRARESENR